MNSIHDLNLVAIIPLAAFVILLLLQTLFPRRVLAKSGIKRIIHNLFLFAVNTLIMRLAVPLSLIACSNWAIDHSFGVFNLSETHSWLAIIICVLILDFAIYWQHVATHKVGWLWRMHKIHHSDTDMDVSTAIRFHPFELVLSLLYKGLIVILLGAPVAAVVIFELLLFVSPAFNHSNLKLPLWADQLLRWFVATPDVHRVHHSVNVDEQDTNYGFFLIWWDKMFGTFTEQPKMSHDDMAIGLKGDEYSFDRVDKMLVGPFYKS